MHHSIATPTQNPAIRLAAVALVAAAVAALVWWSADAPWAAAAAAALAAVCAAALWRPEAVTPLVVLALYTNAAVVAVRFHGLPHVAGMLTPLPLAAPLWYFLVVKRQPLVITRTLPWIVLFALAQTASAAFSRDPAKALEGVKITVLEGLVLYLVITNVVRSPRTLRRSVWALLAAGALMGGLSLWQQATGNFQNDFGGFAQLSEGPGFDVNTARGTVHQPRLCGPVGEQNRYAQIMLMLMPLALMFGLSPRNRWARPAAFAALALAAVGCSLAFSRGAAVGFALVMVLMAAMRYIRWSHLLGVGAAVAALLLAMPQYRARLESIPTTLGLLNPQAGVAEQPDGAIRGRATSMLAAARVFADYPVLGVGAGLFNTYSRDYGKVAGYRAIQEEREAHCLYLEIAAEHGLVGLVAFGGLIIVSLRGLVRLRRREQTAGRTPEANLTAGFVLALAAYLTTGLFLHLSYARYFWLMLGLADAWTAMRTSGPAQGTAPKADASKTNDELQQDP